MPSYILLVNWTDQGILNIKESPERLSGAKKSIKAAGGKMTGFYLTMGRYDMVSIIEAPDDEVVAEILLHVGQGGSVRTETLKAFPEREYRKIIAGLSRDISDEENLQNQWPPTGA